MKGFLKNTLVRKQVLQKPTSKAVINLTTPATPLNNAHPGGFFISIIPMTLRAYEKPPLTIKQQLKLLESRGLVFKDKKQASQYLQFISYYRLCGYALEFEEKNEKSHQYKLGTTFEQVGSFNC